MHGVLFPVNSRKYDFTRMLDLKYCSCNWNESHATALREKVMDALSTQVKCLKCLLTAAHIPTRSNLCFRGLLKYVYKDWFFFHFVKNIDWLPIYILWKMVDFTEMNTSPCPQHIHGDALIQTKQQTRTYIETDMRDIGQRRTYLYTGHINVYVNKERCTYIHIHT